MEGRFSIYKISFPNGKVYVGLTDDFARRKKEHVKNVLSGQLDRALYAAMLKYGYINLKWEIIEDGLTLDEAKQKEINYIKEYKCMVGKGGKGYNMTMGGDHPSEKSYLHEEDTVKEVIKYLEEGKLTYREINEKTGVSLARISWIKNNKTRKEVSRKIIERKKLNKIGSKNSQAKLTEELVSQLKQDFLNGMSRKDLREKYNVSKSSVAYIVTNETWQHVEPIIEIEKKPAQILDEDKVREIRKLIASGQSDKEIGEKYGVTNHTIRGIRRGERWTHVK